MYAYGYQFDVKDIILNLAGGLLGLILFETLAAAVRKVIGRA